MIYVASPYSHPDESIRENRYVEVRKYVYELIKIGEFAYSPIVYAHELSKNHKLPTDALWWQNFNENFMKRSDVCHFYLMDGWKQSHGMSLELAFAEKIGLKVVYVKPLSTVE